MNIFYLDRDPGIYAQMHCDKHVVKMILETAQISFYLTHRVLDGDEPTDGDWSYIKEHLKIIRYCMV